MASVRKRKWTHNGVEKEAWVVAYTDQGGKRRIRTFDKKKDADRARQRIEGEIERGEHVAASATTSVRQAFELFARHCEQREKEGEIGAMRRRNLVGGLSNHLVRPLGGRNLADIGPADVQALYDAWGRSLGPATRRAMRINCKLFEDFLVQRNLLAAPLFGARRLRPTPQTKIDTFDVAMVKALLAAAETRADHQKARSHAMLKIAVHLALFCGLRKGEIFGLRVASLDFDLGFLRIRTALTGLKEIKGPKTRAGIRDVPMPEHLAEMLKAWLRTWWRDNEDDLLFTTEVDTRMCLKSAFYDQWRRLLRKAGLDTGQWRKTKRGYEVPCGKSLHFHALRHFASSWYIAKGMSPPDVARLLGHSHFDTTLQVYAHPVYDESYRRDAIRAASQGLLMIAADPPVRAT